MDRTTKIALATVSVVISIVIIYAAFIIYITWPISEYSVEKAGVFGDSFGILTAIFSGLAFAGVIWTVLTQLQELSITRDQLKNQGIENAFFQMLRLHNEILNEIDLHKSEPGIGTITTTGRDVIKTFSNRLRNKYKSINADKPELPEKEKALEAYNQFWREHSSELAHYFRFLFNIFRYIKDSKATNEMSYATLVRAQLSNQELTLLFYNCLSPQGENFLEYAERYKLFDNITESDLIRADHINLIGTGVFQNK